MTIDYSKNTEFGADISASASSAAHRHKSELPNYINAILKVRSQSLKGAPEGNGCKSFPRSAVSFQSFPPAFNEPSSSPWPCHRKPVVGRTRRRQNQRANPDCNYHKRSHIAVS